MKYETLSEAKSGSYASGTTVTFTFTYSNNIDHIACIYFKSSGTAYDVLRLTSYTITNNVLTCVFTSSSTSSSNDYVFLLATAASY